MTMIMFAQLMMGISIALIPSAIGAITLGLFGRKKLPVRISQNEMWNHSGNLCTTLLVGLISYLLGNIWIFYTFMLFCLASMVSVSFIRAQEINYQAARELPESASLSIDGKTSEPLSSLNCLKEVRFGSLISHWFYIIWLMALK